MSDQELLKLSRLQRKYADLLGEIQKVLRRMRSNDGRADDVDRKFLLKIRKKMDRVEEQMDELIKKIKKRTTK